MKNSFFQALDIIHIWADVEKLPISISRNEIFVSCSTDLSQDAEKVCNFISFILKKRWSYRIVMETDEFKFIFHETNKKNSSVQSNRKKRNKTTKPSKTKGLFD